MRRASDEVRVAVKGLRWRSERDDDPRRQADEREDAADSSEAGP
jgi:hypothetical protein